MRGDAGRRPCAGATRGRSTAEREARPEQPSRTAPHSPARPLTAPHGPARPLTARTAPHSPARPLTAPHGPAQPARPLTVPHGPARPLTAPHSPAQLRASPHGPSQPRTAPHVPAQLRASPHSPSRSRTTPHGSARPRTAPHGPAEPSSGSPERPRRLPRERGNAAANSSDVKTARSGAGCFAESGRTYIEFVRDHKMRIDYSNSH
ncbi:PREDICTED: vegetative cell wall protein gp1-like [Pseudopodoces humilis]|uniref:vegetative cell wall protein gp1-like n=1 Tax=Pseudopodoces humilis TaxID=181119 RepID=UPI0006B6BA06|nr:PREDICTED: vegetative cell wall protein gp1-like [Pseudopodoces humilis]